MSFDFAAFWATLAANAILLSPVEVALLLLITRIYKEVGKLAATYQMLPDLSAEDRAFVRWWATSEFARSKELALRNLKPGTRPPWEVQ